MARRTFDLAVACLLTVVTVAASAVALRHAARPALPGLALVAAATLSLAPLRRYPLGTLAAVTLCTSAYLIMGYAYGPVLIVFMAAVYGATRYAPLRPAVWSSAAALALMLVHLLVSDRPLGWLGVVPVAAWTIVPGTAGYGLRLRQEAARRAARQRVDDERLRVAREVHDIVGHGLVAIKMQADVALHVLRRRPGHAQEALEAISRTSAQALDELRATLAVVRATGDDGGPPVGLDGLEQLRRRMTDAGVRVRLRVSGDAGPALPAAVSLAGYRVVQESLTNALRHGARAEADVTVSYEPGAVAISVANPCTGSAPVTTGSGIAGMRARVESLGGEFSAGPRAHSFRVHARLPTGRPA